MNVKEFFDKYGKDFISFHKADELDVAIAELWWKLNVEGETKEPFEFYFHCEPGSGEREGT